MKNLPSQTTELLESMLEALDQGFIAWDEDYRLVAWNQLFLDFWRLPGHIMRKGKPLLEILEYQASLGSFGEGDPKVVAKAYMATIVRDFKDAAAGSATVEVIVKSESGKWLQMKRRMVEGLGYVTCATDVTEKVASERAANLMYDNIDSFADSVVMVDSDGHIIYSNNRYHEIYPDSPSREEIIGMSQRDLLRRSLDRGLIDDALAKADPDAWIEQKVAERRVDGTTNWETRHSNGRFYQIKQQREKKIGSIIITSDITERKKAEEALKTANETLEARVRERTRDLQEQVRLREIASHAKSEFLANMSHELRTPLNAVLGFSEIMLNEIFGPLGSDKYREYAQDIHMAGGHLLELINDVLDLTKVEAGQWTLNEEAVDLSQINRSMARMLRDQAGSKQIELSLNLPADGDATIFCDERAIKQVTLNLLTNAIKFTENGGRVDVTVEIASDRSAMIRISDTGIGISASDIPKALSAFGQAAATETRGDQGTGLGLPLAKNLTELHGGKLTLESEIGVGTTVIVHFPPERYLSNDD